MDTLNLIGEKLKLLDSPRFEFLGNMPSHWILATLIALAFYFGVSLFRRILVNRLRVLAIRTSTQLDDLVVHVIDKTNTWTILILAIFFASLSLDLGSFAIILRKIMTISVFIQIGIWASTLLAGILKQWSSRHSENASHATVAIAIGFLGKMVIWSLILLLMLDNLGVKVMSLMAGLGVGGIAVALAVQRILGDLLSSISIILDKPFEIGDFIIVGESMGNVEHIGLKTTRLRSLSGEQLIISNSDLLSSRVRNYKRMSERRIAFNIGVTYQTTREQLEAIPKIIQTSIEKQEHLRFERCHLKSFASFAIDFECIYWVKLPDMVTYLDAQQAINLELYSEFAQKGINFAYPTQTVFLRPDTPPAITHSAD
jgi:small-conductance mechanosensitive channel